jgi:hypothetical protein
MQSFLTPHVARTAAAAVGLALLSCTALVYADSFSPGKTVEDAGLAARLAKLEQSVQKLSADENAGKPADAKGAKGLPPLTPEQRAEVERRMDASLIVLGHLNGGALVRVLGEAPKLLDEKALAAERERVRERIARDVRISQTSGLGAPAAAPAVIPVPPSLKLALPEPPATSLAPVPMAAKPAAPKKASLPGVPSGSPGAAGPALKFAQ